MKKYSFFYFLILVSLVFIGCSTDENTEYYSVLGTVAKSNDSVIVVSDDDERLLVNNSGSLSSINDNERIILYFTLIEEPLPSGVDYIIDVYNFTKVLFKPVIELTDQIADSIGNDPMTVRDIWLAKDYLNLNFEFYGNDEVHYINLTRNPGEIPTDTINLEVRHNDNDDPYNYLRNGFVTFDLESLRNEVKDSVVLHIKAKGYNSTYYDKSFTYKF